MSRIDERIAALPMEKQALLAGELARRLDAIESAQREPIAVVGIGCRFPGSADSPERYWSLLCNGVDAVREVPAERWDADALYASDPDAPGAIYSRSGGFLDAVDGFDAGFFRVSPREAEQLDPQQRLLLEVTWEALEDASIAADALADTNVGVFVGIGGSEHQQQSVAAAKVEPQRLDFYAATGGGVCFAAGRIAHFLGLRGPALAVDTACSSSLVAVHLACNSIRNGECRSAIAGGVNVILSPETTMAYCRGRVLSVDERCKTFDASANGIVRGEGCGVVVLKRLTDAQADGDRVWAVIAGSALNHDGPSGGLTVPSGAAQAALIRTSLRNAGVEPNDVEYLEAHGTGTSLGDPIETDALGQVFADNRTSPLFVSSVKTNLGHLEAAAGVAGLIKTVLVVHHGAIPPHLHLERPNPHINLDAIPLKIPTRLTDWSLRDGRRVAGVSSFGMSGTNAHVVVTSAPEPLVAPRPIKSNHAHILPLSARSQSSLSALARQYQRWIDGHRAEGLGELCASAARGRAHHDHRTFVVAHHLDELQEQLATIATRPDAVPKSPGPIAFVFSGQGSQWPTMGRSLRANYAVFRQVIEECDAMFEKWASWSLVDEIDFAQDRSRLERTEIAQPAIFATQVALARLWQSWGIEPAFVCGHSVGEIAAAHISGALDLHDSARIVFHRARVMQQAHGHGRMLTVDLSSRRALERVEKANLGLSVAALNGPSSTVLSGDEEAVRAGIDLFEADGVRCRDLGLRYAFHSSQMDRYREELARELSDLVPGAMRMTFVSTVTGRAAQGNELDSYYWSRNLREPVLFSAAIAELQHRGCSNFVEIGGHPVLRAAISECTEAAEQVQRPLVVSSLRRDEPTCETLFASLGQLYERGYSIDWDGVYPGATSRLPLPTYPWNRARHWPAPVKSHAAAYSSNHPILFGRLDSPLLDGDVFAGELDLQRHHQFKEHLVLSKPLVPAALYLELANAAVQQALGRAHSILNMAFHKAVVIEEGDRLELQVAVSKANSVRLYARRCFSDDSKEDWAQVASATFGASAGELGALPISEVKDLLKVAEPAHFYRALATRGVEYGQVFQGLDELYVGEGRALGRVSLRGEAGRYHVAPWWLDACFQVAAATAGLIDADGPLHLPFEVERFAPSSELWRRCESVWCHAQLRANSRPALPIVDMVIADDAGEVVGAVDGLALRRTDQSMLLGTFEEELPSCVYSCLWERVSTPPNVSVDGRWIVLGPENQERQSLAKALKRCGAEPIEASAGDLADLLEDGAVKPLDGVVCLHGSTLCLGDSDAPRTLYQIASVAGTLSAVGARHNAKLWIASYGARSIGAEHCVPESAALWGLGRAIAMEHPELWGGIVDLDPQGASQVRARDLCRALGTPHEPQQLYRRSQRYVARLDRPTTRKRQTEAMDFGAGSVVVTGGLGALGLELAGWLSARGAQSLYLLGRSQPNKAAQARIDALRAHGLRVQTIQVDVGDHSALASAMEQIRAEAAPIIGVFHLAAVIQDAPLESQTHASFAATFAPKARAAWLLHELTQSDPLQHFVMFSSAAATLGSPGQANYAAANAYLDGLAEHRHANGQPALSIAWGAWAERGLAVEHARGLGRRFASLGLSALSIEDGLRALEALMQQGSTTGVVLAADWDAFGKATPASLAPFVARLTARSAASPAQEDWRLELDAAPRTQHPQLLEQRLQALVTDVMRLPERELVPLDRDLFELGLDSLTALEIRNRVETALGVNVSLRALLDNPNVSSIAQQLLAQRGLLEDSGVYPLVRDPDPTGPLSSAQQRLWFLQRLSPELVAYNEPAAVYLSGELEIDQLQRALDEIVRRHAVLRTVYCMQDGVAVQVVKSACCVEIVVDDCSSVATERRDAEVRRRALDVVSKPFDLETGPLLRVHVYRLGQREHVVFLVAHHIASDAGSMGVILRELTALYAEFRTGTSAMLPELPIQYLDFARWQLSQLDSPEQQQQLAYWENRLRGVPALELPLDRPRPSLQSHRGAAVPCELSADLIEPLRALSRDSGATLFMTVLAAFKVLLHRYTGAKDFAVGVPMTHRTRQETQHLIGHFVNPLALRTDLDGDPSFRTLLERVRNTCREAYANQDVPFEQVVEATRPRRDMSRNPLFQVMFALPDAPPIDTSFADLSMSPWDFDPGTTKFDLMLMLMESRAGLRGKLEFNADLFEVDRIRRMAGHFEVLLRAIVDDPSLPISRLPILMEAERTQLVYAWNATSAALPAADQCIHQLVEQAVDISPDAIALRSAQSTISYGELDLRANQVAHHLRSLGCGVGQRVGVLVERSVELVVALLGILKSGAAYLPLDLNSPDDRIQHQLNEAQADLVLTQFSLLDRLDPERKRVCLDSEWELIAEAPQTRPCVDVSASDLAYVMYTSGSTGRPKGVMVAHRGIVNRLVWGQETFQFSSDDRFLQKTPYTFDVSVWEFFGPLIAGATLVVAEPGGHLDPDYLAAVIRAQQITVVHFVPSMLRVFLDAGHIESCDSLQHVFCSGEAVPAELAGEFFNGSTARLHNLYGPTEASIEVTHWECRRDSNLGFVPMGRPIANTQLYALDANGQPAPIGVDGELYIGGVPVADGYLGQPELTADCFVPDPFSGVDHARLYRTGDVVRVRADGNLMFLGRRDQQVKIRGYRIEMGEIEAALIEHPSVSQCVVVVRHPTPQQPVIVAYLVPTDVGAIAPEALRSFLAAKLPPAMVPARFVSIESIPKTPSGKVDRDALPDISETDETAAASAYVEPSTPLQHTIVRIFEGVLRRDRLGIDDNFFDLGASSLDIVAAHTRLSRELSQSIPLVVLFRHTTIRSLASFLDTSAEDSGELDEVRQRAKRRREATAKRANRLRKRGRRQ